MNIDPTQDARVSADRLRAFVSAVFRKIDATPEDADIVADHLVSSDLSGHASHGVVQTWPYVQSARQGLLKPRVHGSVVRDDPPFLGVEAGFGFGQVVAREATDRAIERARKSGVCVVSLARAHHIGRVGTYGERVVAAGLIGLFFANVVSIPRVAPFGGRDAKLGTNPICVAIPGTANNPPVMLDFATSAIAGNKCRVAMGKGVLAPEGKLIDHEGKPTRDPSVIFKDPWGALLPFGEHKGSGLALICEILAGAVASGMPVTPENKHIEGTVNNMLAFIFDPARIGVPNRDDLTDVVLDRIHGTRPMPGVDEVLVAGEPEARRRAEYARDGVPVDPATVRNFHKLGEEFGWDTAKMLWG